MEGLDDFPRVPLGYDRVLRFITDGTRVMKKGLMIRLSRRETRVFCRCFHHLPADDLQFDDLKKRMYVL